ncbi:heme o synthase [Halostella sp. PRR32]|uniref:heme o synthase n=1 Tax=Halostella sp. PRR32 TaxID=3098147 RepID=UPI002B1DE196|nr:heme o synthase [Halostella sp. PRR32]
MDNSNRDRTERDGDAYPRPVRTDERFTGLVAATAMGVYLLIIVGATTAITDAAAACSTWPACNGQWLVDVRNPDLAVAWGHRVAALVVAGLVLATGIFAWLGDPPRRVRAALTAATLGYPIQVGLGAIAAVSGPTAALSGVHLLLGTGLFACLTLAVAWLLEVQTATPADREPVGVVEEADATEVAPENPTLPDAPLARAKTYAGAYVSLMKPRLMWLLCLVAAAGMALAAGPGLTVRTVVLTLLGGVLAIGASGTFNHVLERDVDRRMNRTSDRPIATDIVSVRNAVAFGISLTALSLVAFLQLNLLAAALGLSAILFYSVIYTVVLKPNTVQNTVIGGAAGALPAVIGWAAVTGSVGVPGLALAGVIFLWTPAHFYNLALAYKDDYARGGFPMMPVVRGEAKTRKHVVYYLAATLVSATVLSAVSELGLLYALTSVALGGVFLWAVIRLHRERTETAALRAFHASNAYLGALLLAVVVDSIAV